MQRLGIGLTLLGLVLGLAGCRVGSPTAVHTPEQTAITITFADYKANRQAYDSSFGHF